MNVKEYIESGILEAYILGALSETERTLVEANISQYPEIATEVAAIELTMQRFAESLAMEPPTGMQDSIWGTLQTNSATKSSVPAIDESQSNGKVIPLSGRQTYDNNWQRAAVLFILIGSMVANFILWNQRNHNKEQLAVVQKQMDSVQTEQQQLAAIVNHYQKERDMMADTGMQMVTMRSMLPGHPMAATVYWSKTDGAAYLSVQKMPMPPAGKQYQMWVIQDGKPVSMGVLPNNLIAASSMDKLPMQVKEGQAFAISLEKEGGNPTPTAVYVLGKVSS